jgi:epoxyqueuosine reductase
VNLAHRIADRARELGFARVGYTPARPLEHAPHLESWLADGMHGDMAWMERHTDLRTNAARLEPGTRTVVALAAPYLRPEPATARLGRIAAYAVGEDYHDVLREKMRQLGAFIAAETGSAVHARPVTDSAPLLERNVAVDAGLGWLGKSAMVLHPALGSYFFLAELLVDIEIGEEPTVHPDRCGRCTRCIDLCPTGAIIAPGRVDARRCISYFTIELRGPIPRQWRTAIGDHLFGCDICQEVCPWNSRPHPAIDPAFAPRPGLDGVDAVSVLQMSAPTFNATFRGTAIVRTKRRGLARNAAVVLGNTGDRRHVAALGAALLSHDEPLVRGHAAWALGVLGGDAALDALRSAHATERDDYVRDELGEALRGGA